MKKCLMVLALAAAPAICAGAARASIVGVPLGPAAPPVRLGPHLLTPFPLDSQPQGSYVSSVASPLGGTVDFSSALLVCQAETSWFGWGHGYTGTVYYTGGFYAGGNLAHVTLALPTGTAAFYVYAQPLHYTTWQITARGQDGPSITQDVYDAAGYGFYGTGGVALRWIELSTPHMDGFGLGEFGMAVVPAPGALLLAGLGAGLVHRTARRGALHGRSGDALPQTRP